MQIYVHYFEEEMMNEGDNPPIGIVLCADKSDSIVKYTLSKNETQVFASKYKAYLPIEEELLSEIKRECKYVETRREIRKRWIKLKSQTVSEEFKKIIKE